MRNASSHRFVIMFTAGILGLFHHPESSGFAADGDNAEQLSREAALLIRRMLGERERIRSGLVEITGSKHLTYEGREDVTGAVLCCLYFDFDRKLLRYDNDEPMYVRVLDSTNAPVEGESVKDSVNHTPGAINLVKFRFLRQPDYCTFWDEVAPGVNSNLSLWPSDKSIGRVLPGRHRLYDVRASGIIGYLDFESGRFEQGTTVRDYCEELLELPVTTLKQQGNRSEITFLDDRAQRVLTLDTSEGLKPIEYRLESLTDPSTQSATVKWNQQDGVWLPASMSIQLIVPQARSTNTYSLNFNWKVVNKQLDDKYFDFRNLPDISPGIAVFDSRGEETVYLGTWKGNGVIEPPPDLRAIGEQRKHAKETFRTWLVLIILIIIVMVVTAYLARRKLRFSAVR